MSSDRPADTSLGQALFRITVVPARAAYLIKPRSSGGFRRAVQEASTRWGGETEPIIPVRRSGSIDAWWEQVVDLGNVDGLVNVDVDPETAQQSATRLGLPLVELEHIDRAGVTQFTCHPLTVAPASETSPTALIARRDGDLWESVAAGDLTEQHIASLEDARINVWHPRTGDEIGRAQLAGGTMVGLTSSQFREKSAMGGVYPAPFLLWVTTPNSFSDCLAFWNLRALRSRLFPTCPWRSSPTVRSTTGLASTPTFLVGWPGARMLCLTQSSVATP